MNEIINQVGTDLGTYGIAGAVLPLVVSIINRPHFPAWAKQLIMVAAAVVVGVLTYGAKNTWDFTDVPHVLAAVAGVAAATQIAYHGLWKKGVAPKIEGGLNAGPAAPQHAATAQTLPGTGAGDSGPVEGDVAPLGDDVIDEPDPTADEVDPDPVEGDDSSSYVEAESAASATDSGEGIGSGTPGPAAISPSEG